MSEQRPDIEGFPDAPGVYLFLDERGRVLYVGKALSLRSRVRSYFTPSGKGRDRRMEVLVDATRDVQFVVTDTENEALVLESNLIKRHRPPYNVRLRDDKHYPYLRVTWNEPFPRLEVARRIQPGGDRFFGPYTRAGDIRKTMHTLRRIFPYRTCSMARMNQRSRPCLNRDLGLCPAPCTGEVSPDEYRETVDQMCLFLSGRQTDVLDRITRRMMKLSENLKFEEAARLRDQKASLESVIQSQKVISSRAINSDYVAVHSGEGDQACVQVFSVREGKLVGQEHFFLEGADQADAPGQVEAFIKQYYARAPGIPPEILVSDAPSDLPELSSFLAELRGGSVAIRRPQRGKKRHLIDLARRNAAIKLEQEMGRQGHDEDQAREDLLDLVREIGLPGPPSRIEGFDVSNLGGSDSVGSMVVFEDGISRPSEYRRYRLDAGGSPDDYALMEQMLERRFSSAGEDRPDLVMVDGGPGQVEVARRVLAGKDLAIPVVGLAKKEELLYRPGHFLPLRLERTSAALRLLQRVRDEAHRFAVTYHRHIRGRARRQSWLDSVPGIGPKRRRALLRHFGSLHQLAGATEDEMAAVPGMTRAAARTLARKLSELRD